ncbi:glycosyltransferase, partial [Pseudomonadota bacterium]
LLQKLYHFQENDLEREKKGHLAWREVYSKHTFSHRLRDICKRAEVTHDWVEYPAISMITPTFRENLLPRCVETFENQQYPNKELIIVFNSNAEEIPDIEGLDSNRKDIRIIKVPQERFVGDCLNLGSTVAKGEYCLRVDDDDHYGKYCIMDISLHFKSMDIDLFGKPTYFFYFAGDSCTFKRPFRVPDLTVIPSNELSKWNAHVAGNLLGGKREFLLSSSYPHQAFAAADSSFLYELCEKEFNYACLDGAGVVIHRSADLQNHTWRQPKNLLTENATELKGKIPTDVMY